MFTRWDHRARRLHSMNAVRARASKADVLLERALRYDFAKLKAKVQLRPMYRTRYAKPVAGQTSIYSTVQTVAGHSVLVREPYTLTPIGKKRVGVQTKPQHYAHKRQRVRAILPNWHLKLPSVFRPRVSTPLQQILVLTFVMKPLQKLLHVELQVILIVEQRRRRSVCRYRRIKTWCQRWRDFASLLLTCRLHWISL